MVAGERRGEKRDGKRKASRGGALTNTSQVQKGSSRKTLGEEAGVTLLSIATLKKLSG